MDNKFFEHEIKALAKLYEQPILTDLEPDEVKAANEQLKNPNFYLRYVIRIHLTSTPVWYF